MMPGVMNKQSELSQAAAAFRQCLGLEGTTLIVGMGKTGLSCVRFLSRLGLPVMITDSRAHPPGLAAVQELLSPKAIFTGGFSAAALASCAQLVLSPGIAQDDPYIQSARQRGLMVLGDIELFARCADAPLVAITGSNGKSTVTALLGEMALQAGLEVRVGGNFGTPALDLLDDSPPALYVLELSSYQLEITTSLRPAAAVILNVSPDHLDRYADMAAYRSAKARIYHGGGVLVVNRDDVSLQLLSPPGSRMISFGAEAPREGEYGLVNQGGQRWLARGGACLLPISELAISGQHNALNALAALALGEAIALPGDAMISALPAFRGLPHRMAKVASRRGIDWYDDSKATNVGATLAALAGLDRRVVLIAGGVGKGADFSPLKDALLSQGRAVVLLGRDAPQIARVLADSLPMHCVATMEEAVQQAAQYARPGDLVLLSPACASLDMFQDYAERGRVFAAAVEALPL